MFTKSSAQLSSWLVFQKSTKNGTTVGDIISIVEHVLTDFTNTLNECREELVKGKEVEQQLRKEVDRHKPLTEVQAAEHLGRDIATLEYYRTLGLDSFKKGGSRWYTKGIIDDWLATGRVNRRSR